MEHLCVFVSGINRLYKNMGYGAWRRSSLMKNRKKSIFIEYHGY